jgi:hypothetical protein
VLSIRGDSGLSNRGITHLTNLTTLDITGNIFITQEVFHHLTGLKRLVLGDTDLSYDRGLVNLTGLVCLSLTQVPSIKDCHLSQLSGLKKLVLSGMNHITDRGVETMSLTYLDIGRLSRITLNCIDQMTTLKDFRINGVSNGEK